MKTVDNIGRHAAAKNIFERHYGRQIKKTCTPLAPALSDHCSVKAWIKKIAAVSAAL